jgi:acetyl esterase/lipase
MGIAGPVMALSTIGMPFLHPVHAVRAPRDVVYREAPVRAPEAGRRALMLTLYEPEVAPGPGRRPAFVAVHGGEAVRWLVHHADRYRIDPKRIAVGGASAGAAVALHQVAHSQGGVPVRAVFIWSGPAGYAGDVSKPGMPPIFIAHGADDASVSPDDARTIAGRARAAGIPCELCICEGLGHVLPLDRRPGGVSLYDRLAGFLWREMDLGALTRDQASRIRAAVAAIPHPADDEAAMPCPK